MLLEIVVLTIVLYVLVLVHKQDIAKGGDGVPVIGSFLEDIDERMKKLLESNKKKKKNSSAAISVKSKLNELEDEKSRLLEDATQKSDEKISTKPVVELEKFESVRHANHTKDPKGDKSKQHHHRHRSKLESALLSSQQQNSTDTKL